jgi:hypothetical protein
VLASNLCQAAQARDVSPGPAEAGDEPGTYRVADGRKHDRDGRGGGLRRLCRECPESGYQHVRPASNQLPGQLWQSFRTSFGRSVLESHVPALAVAQFVEPFQQRLHRRGVLRRSEGEEADPVQLPRRLPLGNERRGEETTGDHREEGASLHGSSRRSIARRWPRIFWRLASRLAWARHRPLQYRWLGVSGASRQIGHSREASTAPVAGARAASGSGGGVDSTEDMPSPYPLPWEGTCWAVGGQGPVADGRRALLRDMFENAKEKLVGERHPFRIIGQGVPAIEPELRVAELAA